MNASEPLTFGSVVIEEGMTRTPMPPAKPAPPPPGYLPPADLGLPMPRGALTPGSGLEWPPLAPSAGRVFAEPITARAPAFERATGRRAATIRFRLLPPPRASAETIYPFFQPGPALRIFGAINRIKHRIRRLRRRWS